MTTYVGSFSACYRLVRAFFVLFSLVDFGTYVQ
jgi:hypothetical protein